MDDFVLSNLHESRNEWCSRLISIFTPLVIEGIKSIFTEAWNICTANDETNKYLMTFQNLLSRIPKWNSVIVEEERKRIIERSGCTYLEDLITCVHIIQLKVLTCVRVGNRQKKIDINIPKLDHFIHQVYIHVARKVYSNVYLFERNISPLLTQKNGRELELIVQECILATVRESVPTEAIIRAYMDESVEQEEEVTIEHIDEPVMNVSENKSEGGGDGEANTTLNENTDPNSEGESPPEINIPEEEPPITVPTIKNISDEPVQMKLSFNDYDKVLEENNEQKETHAPKTIERLERISTERAIQRRLDDEEEENERIKIHTEDASDLLDFDALDGEKRDRSDSVELEFEQL
jgi:hypothetical protein